MPAKMTFAASPMMSPSAISSREIPSKAANNLADREATLFSATANIKSKTSENFGDGGALHIGKKLLRRLFVFRRLENHARLVDGRIITRRNLGVAAFVLHVWRQSEREGDDSPIRGSRNDKRGRLRNVLAQHKFLFDFVVDAVLLHCRDSRPPVGCVLRIRNGDLPHGWLQQSIESLLQIKRRFFRNPQNDLSARVLVKACRLDQSVLFQFLGIVEVRGKKHIEWPTVLDLLEEVPR